MTVLDFRSGGYVDSRDNYAAPESDAAHANYWHSHHVGPQSQDWGEDEAWDEARYATQAGARLRDREGVLGRVARLTHYLGALVSVGLMVALMVWGYQLVVRDVSGVPVIRAVQGDMRVAPSEPGGELTDRTGLAVNEVAAGAQPATVDSVAIAPAPTALTGQDVAMGELGATAQEPSVASDEPVAAPGEAAVAMTDADAARLAEAGVPAVAPGLADAVSASSALTDTAGQPVQDLAITAALTEAGAVPAVTTTTRPMRRPQRIAAASSAPVANDADPVPLVAEAEPVAAPVETPAPAPIQTATVASGAPLVQIGAFDSGSIAESEWSRISGRYGDLFAGKAPVVQEHKAGGRTFYRLRIAGFDNRDDARKFCAALIEAGTDCIPAAAN